MPAPADHDPAGHAHAVQVAGVGTVLWSRAQPGAPVRCETAVLTGLLAAHPEAGAVVFSERPDDVAELLAEREEEGEADRDVGGAASTSPVVDALKRVAGDRVLGGVDRSALRRAVAPAVVRADLLRAALAAAPPQPAVDPLALVARTHRILALPR